MYRFSNFDLILQTFEVLPVARVAQWILEKFARESISRWRNCFSANCNFLALSSFTRSKCDSHDSMVLKMVHYNKKS